MFSFIFSPFARQPLITRFWKSARELNHINVYSMQRLSSHRCAIKKKQLSVKFKLNESFCFRWKDPLALISMVPTINKKKKEGKDVLETPWGCATSKCWSLCEGFMQGFCIFFFEWWRMMRMRRKPKQPRGRNNNTSTYQFLLAGKGNDKLAHKCLCQQTNCSNGNDVSPSANILKMCIFFLILFSTSGKWNVVCFWRC